MALRLLARRLRSPATAALQRASPLVVSPAAGSRFLTSHPLASEAAAISACTYRETGKLLHHGMPNGRARRAANGTRNAPVVSKEYKKLVESVLRDMEKDRKSFEEISTAMDNLPRNIVLTCTVGLAVFTTGWAYLIGVFDENKAVNGEQ